MHAAVVAIHVSLTLQCFLLLPVRHLWSWLLCLDRRLMKHMHGRIDRLRRCLKAPYAQRIYLLYGCACSNVGMFLCPSVSLTAVKPAPFCIGGRCAILVPHRCHGFMLIVTGAAVIRAAYICCSYCASHLPHTHRNKQRKHE